MAGGEDWLLRPVLEGLCSYESLKNGALDLEDVARMNDALAVRDANEQRIARSLEQKK